MLLFVLVSLSLFVMVIWALSRVSLMDDLKCEVAAPKVKAQKEEAADGIQRPDRCSVFLDYRYDQDLEQFSGANYVCRWTAACRGDLIGSSPWFRDRWATATELMPKMPWVTWLFHPSRKRQQTLVDKTREVSATNYWKLIEALEAKGWQPVYSNDGTADSMVKISIPKQEPVKPKQWR